MSPTLAARLARHLGAADDAALAEALAACEAASADVRPAVARVLGGLRGLLAELDADEAIRRPDADAERQRADLRRDLESQKFALDQHAIVSVTDTEGRILYANVRATDGSLDLEDLESKIRSVSGRLRLVTVTGGSNVTGSMPPIRRIA